MSALNLFDLTGKNAVVTGGSAGIGLDMCKIFAQQGAKVFILDLHGAAKAADVVNAIPNLKATCVV